MDIAREVPDGGWGWVVVVAVAFINMTNQSILSVFGLLFGGQLQSMQQETFTAALIINLNSLALNFSGLFIGPAIKSFKPRNVAACGCMMVSFGMFICAFATNSLHFIVGYSFFVGIGLGLIAPSTFMAITDYFSAKRGRAVGISLAGAGVGQVFVPHIVRYFLDNYDFRTAVLAMSVLSFTGIIGAFLLRPLTISQKHNNHQHIKLLLEADEKDDKKQSGFGIKIVNETNMKDSSISSTQDEPITRKSAQNSWCNKMCSRLVQSMDLELLMDPIFWSIIIGMALVYTSTINFTMLFPNFLQYSVGLPTYDVAMCMSIVASADIVCRLLLPCITDKLRIPYRVVFLLGTIGLLISRAVLAESIDMTTIIVTSIFIGMSKSATVLNNNLTISGYLSSDKLAGGLGLNMIAKGVLVITIGQLLGWIRDFTDSYIFCLHSQNVLLLFVILLWAPEIGYRYSRKRNVKKVVLKKKKAEKTSVPQLIKINV